MHIRRTVRILPSLFVIVAYLVLGYLLFHFSYHYTIPIPIMDEWGIVDFLFNKFQFGYLFWQSNEHRVGTGYLYLRMLSSLTHWNLLYETISNGILIVFASIFAIRIKSHFTHSIDYADIIIPIIFLNVTQYENITWGIVISHVLPTFFLMWSLFLFIKPPSVKHNFLLVLVAVLSAYSCFQGLVVCCIILGCFILQFIASIQKKKRSMTLLVFIICIFVILGSYFIKFAPTLDLGIQNFSSLFLLFPFVSREISTAIIGYSDYKMTMLPLSFSMIAYALLSVIFWIKQRYSIKSYIIVSLFIYSISFMLFIFFGRIGLGIESAAVSRYVTFLSPLFFGCYLISRIYLKGFLSLLGGLILVIFIYVSIINRPDSYLMAKQKLLPIEIWKDCYLKYENVDQCNIKSGISVFEGDPMDLLYKINGLKQRRWNLFNQ